MRGTTMREERTTTGCAAECRVSPRRTRGGRRTARVSVSGGMSSSSRRDACIPTSTRRADRPSDRAPRVWAYCVGTSERGVPGRRVVVSVLLARGALQKARARAFRSLRRGHVASDGAGAITETRATMASAIAALPVSRVVPVPRAHRRAARRSLVVVAGKKGAWAKEFDEEYIKKNAPVETVDDGWPGLDSACRARPHFAREKPPPHSSRARVSSATRASPRRSRSLLGLPATKKRRVRLAYPRSADRSPPPRPPSTSQRIRRRTPRRTTSS